MTTKQTIERYFSALKDNGDWRSLLADDVAFTSHTSPVKHVDGRDAFLDSTKRFYSTISSVDLRTLVVDGDRAVAATHYELQPPKGPSFGSDVAEMFVVRDDKIVALDIFFDTAPFPKAPA